MRSLIVLAAATLATAACAGSRTAGQPATPRPGATGSAASTRPRDAAPDTVTIRDAELERRASRLELHLIEKETQIELLETRLADTRDEVVRTMARLQTAASRAEAASGIAEADVALQTLRSTPGAAQLPDLPQLTRMVRQSSAEFNRQNFGGALYLATQAKGMANAARARLTAGDEESARDGETVFAVPIRLKATTRGNVRSGPGTGNSVVFSLDEGAVVTAFGYEGDWVRIMDDGGRAGWIFRELVGRP